MMKKILLLLTLLVAALSARADVTINAANFPDDNFRAYLLSEYPNGYITTDELNSRTELNVDNKNISRLRGVGNFRNLISLSCAHNNIAVLPPLPSTLKYLYCNDNHLSELQAGIDYCSSTIQVIDCSNNDIYSNYFIQDFPALRQLNISYCPEMTALACNNNPQLVTLKVDGCANLNGLICSNDNLSTLSINGCTALKILNCSNNQLTSLPTLPDSIEVVDCYNNKISGSIYANSRTKLTSLDVSNNPSITLISVGNDLALTTLGIEGCTGLKTLSMSNLPSYDFSNLTLPSALEYFSCYSNGLTSLPALPSSLKILYCHDNQLTSLPALPSGLTDLSCSDNQLTSLPTMPATIETVFAENNQFTKVKINAKNNLQNLYVGNNPLLTEINCIDNALRTLDFSGCTALKKLYGSDNQLATLNVQGFSALEKVWCGANQLTSLSFQDCNALTFVNCCDNQIKDSAMTAMIGSLRTMPSGTQGTLQVLMLEGDGNTITTEQVKAARNKGWIPYEWDSQNFVEIPVEDDVPGDVTGESEVDIEDVNAIINIILKVKTQDDYPGNSDLNSDGAVDVDDMNMVINIILTQ